MDRACCLNEVCFMERTRNQSDFQQKLQKQMEIAGLDALLLSSAESMFYASGFASRSVYSNGQVGNTWVVVPKDGNCTVICSQFESKTVRSECTDVNVVTYPIWLYIADFEDDEQKQVQPDPNKALKLAVEVINSSNYPVKRLGVEMNSISHGKFEYLAGVFGKKGLVDCNSLLIEARKHKTPWEIDVIRENTVMSERQMKMTSAAIDVGMTEEDIMRYFCVYGYAQSKEVYAIRQAHTYSEHYSPAYIPRKHPLKNGDIVRLDGGIVRKGYPADLGRSFVVGDKLDPECKKIYDLLYSAYELGLSMIGPGVKCADVFNAMLGVVQKKIPAFKRGHFGHSLSPIRGEDYPFISNANPGVFEPGMIFCIEAPYYSSGLGSYNVEDTLLITDNGYELFTHANRELFWR